MSEYERATLGGGCFWCIEAALEIVPGVASVTSGYAGGDSENPTYEEVCAETTGHAEVVQIEYDPTVVSYDELLDVFFTIHDPTQRNRQGPDVGTQYRSIILSHDEDQHAQASAKIAELADVFDRDIVTEVVPLERFWEAEAYHQPYFEKNPADAYCQYHAAPKVEKVASRYADAPQPDH